MKRLLPILTVFFIAGAFHAGTVYQAIGPADAQAAAPHADESSLSGVVLETMDASRYTYLLLDTGSMEVWVAGNPTAVKAGDRMEVTGILPMEDFYSRSLDRTFDKIYFASMIHPAGAEGAHPALPPGHPEIPGYRRSDDPKAYELPVGHSEVQGSGRTWYPAEYELPPGHPEVPDMRTFGDIAVTGIEPASGGMTVAEVYDGKAELAGREVAVRGRVTKVNNGILGRNWIHLKDGSGEQGTDDLTVTSMDQTARVGDTVVAKGVVGLERDFGSGYFYAVLLEDAVLDVE